MLEVLPRNFALRDILDREPKELSPDELLVKAQTWALVLEHDFKEAQHNRDRRDSRFPITSGQTGSVT
jgi:hypothetical protein